MVTTRSADKKRNDLALRSRSAEYATHATPTRYPERVDHQTMAKPSLSVAMEDDQHATLSLDVPSARGSTATPLTRSRAQDVFQTPATTLRINPESTEDGPNTTSTESSAVHEYHTAEEGEIDEAPEILSVKRSTNRQSGRRRGQKANVEPTVLRSNEDDNARHEHQDIFTAISPAATYSDDSEHVSRDGPARSTENEMDVDSKDPQLELFRLGPGNRRLNHLSSVVQLDGGRGDVEISTSTSHRAKATHILPGKTGNSFERYRQQKLSRHQRQTRWSRKRFVFATA